MNAFEVLQIQPNASDEEIKIAFRRQAKLYHPDINKSPDAAEMFRLVTDSYHQLINRPKWTVVSGISKDRTGPLKFYEIIGDRTESVHVEAGVHIVPKGSILYMMRRSYGGETRFIFQEDMQVPFEIKTQINKIPVVFKFTFADIR